MKEVKLLVVGTPSRGVSTVWDDAFYVPDSPYADEAWFMSYGVRAADSNTIVDDFHALRDPKDQDEFMKEFHFVLFAKQADDMDQTLMQGALALLGWFSRRGHQILLVPHDGGTNCGVGRHWHVLINPYSATGQRFSDREEDYRELMDYLNQDTGMSWSLGFSVIRRSVTPNPFVEVYDLNELLLVPADGKVPVSELQKLVESVNRESVSSLERLSDSVYLLHADDASVTVAAARG